MYGKEWGVQVWSGFIGIRCRAVVNTVVDSGSCDRASLTWEKKEPTDDTSIDVIHNRLTLNMFLASLCPSSGEQTV